MRKFLIFLVAITTFALFTYFTVNAFNREEKSSNEMLNTEAVSTEVLDINKEDKDTLDEIVVNDVVGGFVFDPYLERRGYHYVLKKGNESFRLIPYCDGDDTISSAKIKFSLEDIGAFNEFAEKIGANVRVSVIFSESEDEYILRFFDSSGPKVLERIRPYIESLTTFNFLDFISEMVWDIALEELAEFYWQGEALEKPYIIPLHSEAINDAVRHAVFEKAIADKFESKQQYLNAFVALSTNDQEYWEFYGLHEVFSKPLSFFRTFILEVARGYLKNPDNLWDFYIANRDMVLAKIIEKGGKESILKWIPKAEAGMEESLFLDFRKVHKYFLWAEKDFNNIKGRDCDRSYKEIITNKKMSSHKAILDGLTPDLYASMFAMRRFNEGGDELVKMWIKVLADFETMLKKSL